VRECERQGVRKRKNKRENLLSVFYGYNMTESERASERASFADLAGRSCEIVATTYMYIYTHTQIETRTHTLSLTHSLSHTQMGAFGVVGTNMKQVAPEYLRHYLHMYTHTLCLSLSHTHAHTHTNTRTHTQMDAFGVVGTNMKKVAPEYLRHYRQGGHYAVMHKGGQTGI